MRLSLAVLAAVLPLTAATRLSITVVDQRSGHPLTGLSAANFAISDAQGELAVETASYSSEPVDVLLLLDGSVLGQIVKDDAPEFIAQLDPGERMAVAVFRSSADLIEDFTSNKEALTRALARVTYGGSPRLLDALYAALDGGFDGAGPRRRALLLLASGVDGPSRVSEQEVLRLARRNAVSIYAVYAIGSQRSGLESLARQTGGAAFDLRDAAK